MKKYKDPRIQHFENWLKDKSNCHPVEVWDEFTSHIKEKYQDKVDAIGEPFIGLSPLEILERTDLAAYDNLFKEYVGTKMTRANGYIKINNDFYKTDDIESALRDYLADTDHTIKEYYSFSNNIPLRTIMKGKIK